MQRSNVVVLIETYGTSKAVVLCLPVYGTEYKLNLFGYNIVNKSAISLL